LEVDTNIQQLAQLYNMLIRVGTSKAPPLTIAGISKRVQANTPCWFLPLINSQILEVGAVASQYAWDYEGDGIYDIFGANVQRTYVSNGTYNATFRITDSNGMQDTDSISVVVWGATTTITGTAVISLPIGATVPFTFTGTNLKNVTAAHVTALLTSAGTNGVTVIGTAVPNAVGTSVTGLSLVAANDATPGTRNLRISNTDGTATAVNRINVQLICPSYSSQPLPQTLTAGATLTLTAAAIGTGPVAVQWLKDNAPLTDDARITGAATGTLTITGTLTTDTGNYSSAATNACGTTNSTAVAVTINPPAPIACALADVASDALDTTYNPNGSIGSEDLDAFIAGFVADNTAIADVASDALDTTYTPNGSVGPEDLDAFISSFIAGC